MAEKVNTDIVPRIPRADFPPGRSAPCFCGSGKRFKRCCGQTGDDRPTPVGIGIVPEFLDADTCAQMSELAENSSAKWLEVVDTERSTAEKIVRKLDNRRVTERVEISEHQNQVDQWVRRALQEVIVPAWAREFAWFEQPQMLKYTPGGFYKAHADSDNFNEAQGQWIKELDRDASLLIYLNDDYEGGALRFEYFDYTLRPRAGMLVFFPSDSRYLHQALSVTAGRRFAVVSWAAFKDEPRVQTQPPDKAVFI